MSSKATAATARTITAAAKTATGGARWETTSQGPYSFRVVLRDSKGQDDALLGRAATLAIERLGDLTASWGVARSARGTQLVITVTDEAARSAALEEATARRDAALAAARQEVRDSRDALGEDPSELSVQLTQAHALRTAGLGADADAVMAAARARLSGAAPAPVTIERIAISSADALGALEPEAATVTPTNPEAWGPAAVLPAEDGGTVRVYGPTASAHSATEYVVWCPNHRHYLRHASAGGTTWTDSQEEARRYPKAEARRQAEVATWLDHNPTAWAVPSAGPAELELTDQARATIAAMREARESAEVALTPAVVTLTNPELWG